MREKLKQLKEVRAVFTAVFVKFSGKKAYKYIKKTALFCHICDETGKEVTDHLWFNLTKGFQLLNLQRGDVVEFRARVKQYTKGYKGYNWHKAIEAPLQIDYHLSFPTKARIIEHTSLHKVKNVVCKSTSNRNISGETQIALNLEDWSK